MGGLGPRGGSPAARRLPTRLAQPLGPPSRHAAHRQHPRTDAAASPASTGAASAKRSAPSIASSPDPPPRDAAARREQSRPGRRRCRPWSAPRPGGTAAGRPRRARTPRRGRRHGALPRVSGAAPPSGGGRSRAPDHHPQGGAGGGLAAEAALRGDPRKTGSSASTSAWRAARKCRPRRASSPRTSRCHGACTLDVGGFDQSLRLFEDAELGMRFERAGAKMRFSPGARAVHRSDIGSDQKWEKRQGPSMAATR